MPPRTLFSCLHHCLLLLLLCLRIAAEVDPKFFDYHDEFVVGDGRRYGTYTNHGPLPAGQVRAWDGSQGKGSENQYRKIL